MKENLRSNYLTKAFFVDELDGWLAKRMIVPPGKLGLTVDKHGQSHQYPPGKHRVLKAHQRFTGLGAGFQAGYVPSGCFPVYFQQSNLLSGDQVLIDMSCAVEVEVQSPVLFFQKVTLHRRAIPGDTLSLDSPGLMNVLDGVVGDYLAEDLCSPGSAPIDHAINQILTAHLQMMGMRLLKLSLVHFLPKEQTLVKEEKLLDYQEKLNDIQLQKKLLAIETQEKLDEFMQQEIDPDWIENKEIILPVGTDKKTSEAGPTFWHWLKTLGKDKRGSEPFRLDALWKNKKKDVEKDPSKPVSHRKPTWWMPTTLVLLLYLGIGLGATLLTVWLETEIEWFPNPSVFLIPIWLVVIQQMLVNLVRLVEKWEKGIKEERVFAGGSLLDDLSQDNRLLTDRLVRDQCALMMNGVHDILEDAQRRTFREGSKHLAQKLLRLKQKAADTAEDFKNPQFGACPYIRKDLNVSRELWASMLEYDEVLLIKAGLINQQARLIPEKLVKNQLDVELIDNLEFMLDQFQNDFMMRAQALKPTDANLKEYQLLDK